MSVRRYIAILPRAAEHYSYWRARLPDSIDPSLPFTVLVDGPGLIVLSNMPGIALRGVEAGLILGDIMRVEDAAPCERLDPAQTQAIAVGGADHLIRRFWGAYIALIRKPRGAISVVRAPLGDLPAYIWQSPWGLLIASDVELLERIGGYAPAIDLIGLAEHLVASDLRRPRTCLVGIEELMGGTEGCWHDGQWSVVERWSPWVAVPACPRSVNRPDVAAHLSAVIRRSVAARTARHERVLVLLSGGLDSSIVAASLAGADRPVHALTMVTRDAGGDERHYAAATASALGVPLTAVQRDVASVDVTCSLARGTPRPAEHCFAQATHAAVQALALETGADAVVHGGGGDNIFCSLQSAAPVADRLLTNGPDRRFWAVVSEIAVLAQVSVLHVIAKAIARAYRHSRDYRFLTDETFLTPEAVAAAAGAHAHPWLRTPRGMLPGSAAHIGLIVAAQSVVESPDPRLLLPWMAPLITQPVVEACVSIPSWSWYDRGCNRAVARHAFSESLPNEIIWRKSKGAMNSFIVEIFEANRAALSALLLDGELTSRGLIDRHPVRAVLDDPGPTRGQAYGRVMRLADVEAWARSWAR